MKKLIIMFYMVVITFLLKADTETVDGYTWTYRIIGETAEIISSAISPSPAGVVTIPSMLGGYPVTSIGNDALYGCSLICVTIPNSVTNIGLSAFSGCHSLAEIIVEEGNTFYKSLNALLLTKDGETLVHGVNGIVDIPDGVLNITNNAFSGCSGLTNVMIPSSVTIIGDNAFRNCTGLANVIVPNSVKSIGSYAFSGCDRLTTMMIPSDVAYIGSNAFAGTPFYSNQPDGLVILGTVLYKIKGICPVEVIIPNGVTSISPEAFYKRDLTSVTIPDSAVSVGSNAFWGCSELTSVTIPDSVTSIGNGAFDNCYSLTSITIPQCVFCDGYSPSLKRVFGYSYQAITNVVISEGVTNIVDCAFTSCRNLTGVTIPGSVTRIGSSAFRDCSGLTSVTIPDSVTSIGRNAFDGCSGLTSVTMPDSVTSIGEFAFRGTPLYDDHPEGLVILGKVLYGIKGSCPAMINIPDGVISISADAFSGCLGLTSVTIPDSVTSIGWCAFSRCSGLTSVTIPDSVTNIEDRAFQACTRLTSVTIPQCAYLSDRYYRSGFDRVFPESNNISEVIICDGVTSIGTSAFYRRSSLTRVVLPNSVTNIGHTAFGGCSGLTNITIPDNVTSIGSQAFLGCSGLTSVTIPDNVTSIGPYAFSGCSGLTNIAIPESVVEIGINAFNKTPFYDNLPDGCIILGKVFYAVKGTCPSEVVIPKVVINLGPYAFFDCSGLQEISVESGNACYKSENGLLLSKDGKTLIHGVNGIVVIPDGVTTIENNAFNGCSGLTRVTIPESVTNIGDDAFLGCCNLINVTIPNSVTNISSSAFDGCCGFMEIFVESGNLCYKSDNGLLLSKDGKVLIKGVNGNVIIPDGVTNICASAFYDCKELTSVTIPVSVTSIGNNAFQGCSGLQEIVVEEENANYKSVNGLLLSKDGKLLIQGVNGSVIIPDGVTNICASAFYDCKELTSVTIPVSVTSIGNNAFQGCSGLQEIVVEEENANYKSVNGLLLSKDGKLLIQGVNGVVTIPEGVTNIGSNAFYGCSGLTNMSIPNSVTNIGVSVFEGCNGLTNVMIPQCVCSSGIQEIFPDAYSKITDIIISEGTTHIKASAFSGCIGLTRASIPSSVTSINASSFTGCCRLTEIIVDPENQQYKSVSGLLMSKDDKTLIHGVNGVVTIPEGTTEIGNYAFEGCSGLTCVTIPEGVTKIGTSAFEGCNNLISVLIPESVTCIRAKAFYGCKGLMSVTIPVGAMSHYGLQGGIGSYAFAGCGNLTDVVILDNVTNSYIDPSLWIDSSAFNETPFYDNLPDGVVVLGSFVYKIKGDCPDEVIIPEGATYICGEAFYGCSGLTSVMIPDSVTSIGWSAFAECSNLTNVTIPSSVTYIGSSAFSGCSNLTDMTIPSSVTNIGSSVFSGCNKLVNIVVEEGNAYYKSENSLLLTKDGKSLIQGVNGVVTIPNGVTNICYGAFSGCSGLTSVTIPNSVTRISERVFYNCSGLTSVTIPNSVTHISLAGGSSIFLTFWGCNGLSEIIVEDGNPIFKSENGLLLSKDGKWLFKGVNGSVAIPNGVTSITDYAFEGCRGLTSVTIPDSVTMIGDVFSGCDGLMRASFLGKVPGCYVTYAGLGSDGGRSIEYDYDGRGPSRFDNTTNPLTVTKIGFPSGDWPIYVTEAWDGYGDTWFGHPVKRVRNTEVTVEGKALSIPGAWMAQYPSVVAAAADDAGSAVEAVAANGRKVWECYALGLDPEKVDEDFKIVSFPMKADGTPDVDNIVFDPPREKWNVQGARAVLQGASELGGEWRAVTEENKASFRFFKVVVELP